MAYMAHLAAVPQGGHPQGDTSNSAGSGGSLDVDARDARVQPRRELQLATNGVLPNGLRANVTVHNISAAGLLLETDALLDKGEKLAMDLPHAGAAIAVVVWQSGSLFGCAFERALSEGALAAIQLRADRPQAAGSASAGEDAEFAEKDEAALHDGAIGPGAGSQSALPNLETGHMPESLGSRLARLRRERGLTLAQVADALGVSKPTVWAWEKGKARPIPSRLGPIAETLGVDPDILREHEGEPRQSALIEECRARIAAACKTQPSKVRILLEI